MTLDKAFLDTWTPRALAVLRIVTGYLLIQHGTAKLFHFPHDPMFDDLQFYSMVGAAGIIELCGGVLVLLGLFTRPAAFIISGMMAVAYFMAHAPQGNVLAPMLNHGELAVVYCFLFLFMAAAGAGAWSVDAAMRRSSPARVGDSRTAFRPRHEQVLE